MTGDQDDFLARLKGTLPPWFPSTAPILDGVLSGLAWAASFVYGLIQYAKLQTRLATASDDFLDILSADFFGAALPRKTNEGDTNFRARILTYLFRERGTRNALRTILTEVTGREPRIFEAWNPNDTGGYNLGGVGYGAAGAYGSLLLNSQVFITAYRQQEWGVPNVAGYGVSVGGYGVASQLRYASNSDILSQVSDTEIYGAAENVRPVGTTFWMQITN